MSIDKNQYTEEELELLDALENQGLKSIPDLDSEKERYKLIFGENATKRKQVNLRLLERDLYKIRTKALVQGIPYQTLISSIVHRYVNGELVTKD